MGVFIKATGGVLVALVLYIVLAKQGKDISMLLTTAVCSMIAAAAVQFLEPVIAFLEKLRILGNIDPEMLGIILKTVGVGIIAEITGLVCTDAGNAALGKTLQFLAAAVVLWMAIPLFTGFIELVEEILISL